MGLDRYVLQLLLNVVVITGTTSMALMWYLRRQDKMKLRFYFSLRQKPPAGPARTDPGPEARGGGEAECTAVSEALLVGDQDIRQYVARRSRTWVSAAKTN